MADEGFSREQLDETEKLRAEGRASKADVDNFRVRALGAKANVTAAIGARETGRVILAELMGLTCGTLPSDLNLSPLEEESEEEMASLGPELWIQRAKANRPDIQQLEFLLASDEEQVRSAKGYFMPTAAVSGSWGFDRSSTIRYTHEDQSAAAAFELRWDLFTGGARRARVRQAESTRAETAARLNRLRLAVQSQVRQAIIDLTDAQQQIVLRRETLETARENRRIVQAGYVAGKETLTRLNEAQRDFITADADLALARIRLRQAWTDLFTAVASHRDASEEVGEPGTPDGSRSD
jgi:outer membrane protein